MNPHWEILNGVKATLELQPPIAGLGEVRVRELPYLLATGDPMPLTLVTPPDGQGERVVRHLFRARADSGGITWWDFPVLVLLISVSNRALASGLEARLQTRHDVRQRLFATDLPGAEVFDCDPDPRGVAPLQAALGAGYVVSGFQFGYRRAVERRA